MPKPSHQYNCTSCALWYTTQKDALNPLRIETLKTAGTLTISTSMCYSMCGQYCIFHLESLDNWQPAAYRSKCKFTLTSVLYLLDVNVSLSFPIFVHPSPDVTKSEFHD